MKDKEFQKKIERTREVEREILKWYQKNVDSSAMMPPRHSKKYDIICKKVGDVEVKEDRMAHQTGYYAIEYKDSFGEPSGIAATTAKEFVIVDGEVVCFISTTALAYIIDRCNKKRVVDMGYTTKDGRKAKGWLIPRTEIVYSPYTRVLEKWFK